MSQVDTAKQQVIKMSNFFLIMPKYKETIYYYY